MGAVIGWVGVGGVRTAEDGAQANNLDSVVGLKWFSGR